MNIISPSDIFCLLGPLTTTFLLGFTTVLLALWYSSRKHSYWKNLGIPHVKPYPIFGSALEYIFKPLHDLELERYNKFGRIYGFFEGHRPFLTVAEPDILRNVLVKDFQVFTGRRKLETGDKVTENISFFLQGEDWKRVRSIVTSTFSTGKIKRMIGIFKDCSKTLVKNFRDSAEKGEPVEVKRIYGAFTMDTIASSAFSTKIDSHNDPNNPFVKAAKPLLTLTWRFMLYALLPGVMKLFQIKIFSPKGVKFFTDATMQIMQERKRTGQTRNDFLQLLMDTAKKVEEDGELDMPEKEDDITDNYGKDENDVIFKNITSKKSLSMEELIAQCFSFFLAGYDTTSTTLSFISYLLALNPEVQEKLIQELDDVLREHKGDLTYEALQSMKYLDNVISETFRIYPPVSRIERLANEDYTLRDTGITIAKDVVISIPVYCIHRDPAFFPDPLKFEPDRWLPEERANRIPYTYMPFGAGPRNCIGMRFALMEIKVCLVYVLSNFRIKKCSKTKVPLDYFIGQGVMLPKEVNVLFEIRKDSFKAV